MKAAIGVRANFSGYLCPKNIFIEAEKPAHLT